MIKYNQKDNYSFDFLNKIKFGKYKQTVFV